MTTPKEAAQYLANEAGISLNGTTPLLTEYGNAQRLVEWHGEELRYSYLWKKWLVWVGTHWSARSDGEAMRRAKTNRQNRCTNTREPYPSPPARNPMIPGGKELAGYAEGLLKWARQSESRRILEATMALAESEPGMAVEGEDRGRRPLVDKLPQRDAGPPGLYSEATRPQGSVNEDNQSSLLPPGPVSNVDRVPGAHHGRESGPYHVPPAGHLLDPEPSANFLPCRYRGRQQQ